MPVRKQYFILAAVLIVPLLLSVPSAAFAKGSAAKKDESLRRGETRPTLDPEQFRDDATRQAYRIAREIPWVLDSIFCYCYCEESAGHKSVLSCFVDTHAAM